MIDIISINRQFLVMAREVAQTGAGEVITGLPRPVLDRLAKLSLDQIEDLAKSGVSLITLRLNHVELDRLVSLPSDSQRSAYAVAVLARQSP